MVIINSEQQQRYRFTWKAGLCDCFPLLPSISLSFFCSSHPPLSLNLLPLNLPQTNTLPTIINPSHTPPCTRSQPVEQCWTPNSDPKSKTGQYRDSTSIAMLDHHQSTAWLASPLSASRILTDAGGTAPSAIVPALPLLQLLHLPALPSVHCCLSAITWKYVANTGCDSQLHNFTIPTLPLLVVAKRL